MNIRVDTSSGKAEIEVTVDSNSNFGFGGNASEHLLVPEARRLRDQLDQAIKKAEQLNKPRKKFGDLW